MATEDLLCRTKRKQGLVFGTQNHLRATARICLAVVGASGSKPRQHNQLVFNQYSYVRDAVFKFSAQFNNFMGILKLHFHYFLRCVPAKLVSSSWFELEPGDDHLAVSVVSFYGNY